MLQKDHRSRSSLSRRSHSRSKASVVATLRSIPHVHNVRGTTKVYIRELLVHVSHVVRWDTMQPSA